ncbi:MAG: Zeta toxin family protein [Candidatus Omnitrophica bacterium CG11_big_fil_rev_8_21_14_0_20_64_10]|nr:MAG: Zeta toxin family protein [Candidatus Omnitrophica bacterium CG11_big_fil_rev_8_21_14_0_20_64_10]
MTKKPQVYIIAGPNGSGKTTFASKFLPKYADCPSFINADTIARGLSGFSPDAVALKAGRILLEQIDSYASRNIDFAFETTLSGINYLSRLKGLKKRGYAIHLFFLWIPDVRLSLARIASRVKRGGHDIPEKVVRRRFHKGIANLFKHYKPILDSWMLFDNSESAPQVIAEEKQGELRVLNRGLYEDILRLAEGK